MEFIPELWEQIKQYAGIYHITTHWDLTKLDNNDIDVVIKYIPNTSNKHIMNNYLNHYNINNYNTNKIAHIWRHLNKQKLYNVYEEFKHRLCPYNPEWNTVGEMHRMYNKMYRIIYILPTHIILSSSTDDIVIRHNLKREI